MTLCDSAFSVSLVRFYILYFASIIESKFSSCDILYYVTWKLADHSRL